MNTPPTTGNKPKASLILSQTNGGLHTSKSSNDYQYLDDELLNRHLVVKQGILLKRDDKVNSNAVEFYFVLE